MVRVECETPIDQVQVETNQESVGNDGSIHLPMVPVNGRYVGEQILNNVDINEENIPLGHESEIDLSKIIEDANDELLVRLVGKESQQSCRLDHSYLALCFQSQNLSNCKVESRDEFSKSASKRYQLFCVCGDEVEKEKPGSVWAWIYFVVGLLVMAYISKLQ